MQFCSIYPEPMRLDRFLRALWGASLSQGMIEKICRQKKVTVNGQRALTKTRICPKDEIHLHAHLPVAVPDSQKDDTLPLEKTIADLIVYDRPDFCIIYKPYGLPSQGGPGITESVAAMAGSDYWIVHRLDRLTEGLMILAKNRQTAARFMALFQTRQIKKSYYAIVKGIPKQSEGTIDLSLKNVRVEGDDKMIVAPDGDKAITHYKVVRALNKHHTLMLLEPLTGRKHQLRVHMAALGTPILGDPKYGKKAKRMHLYACQIRIDGELFVSRLGPVAKIGSKTKTY